LRKEKEQSDLRIQEHIQRLEAKEKERKARKRGHSRRKPSQEKQTPKISKFYGGSDPKIFLDWEAKVMRLLRRGSRRKPLPTGVQPIESYRKRGKT